MPAHLNTKKVSDREEPQREAKTIYAPATRPIERKKPIRPLTTRNR